MAKQGPVVGQHGLEVTVHDGRNGVELSGAVEVAAYRLVQEALTNVVRHSNARHVAVALRATDDGFGRRGRR